MSGKERDGLPKGLTEEQLLQGIVRVTYPPGCIEKTLPSVVNRFSWEEHQKTTFTPSHPIRVAARNVRREMPFGKYKTQTGLAKDGLEYITDRFDTQFEKIESRIDDTNTSKYDSAVAIEKVNEIPDEPTRKAGEKMGVKLPERMYGRIEELTEPMGADKSTILRFCVGISLSKSVQLDAWEDEINSYKPTLQRWLEWRLDRLSR